MSEQINQNLNNEKEDKVNSSKENYSNGKSNINDGQREKKENKNDYSQNYYIFFHNFSKDRKKNENSKNSGTIQSIVINKNLRITLSKIKNQIRGLPNNSKNIYYRKSLTKGNYSLNSNILSKKNMTTSQSLVNTNMDTNYDYDSDNKQNYNILNFMDNLDKFSILEKKNYFIDVSFKEYLQNETKNILSARHNYENKENINNNENNSIKKDDKKENKIQKIVDLRLNSEVIPYIQKQKTQRFETHKKQDLKNKHKSSIRAKFKSFDSKGSKFKNNKSFKTNPNHINPGYNNKNKLLIAKSYSLLSSEGNFSTKPKKKTFIEEEKNNSRNLNKIKNYYNKISKIDYISFREKKIIDNNSKTSKIKEKNILKNKENKRIPCKLLKKDSYNIISSARIASLIKSIGIKRNSRSKNKDKNKTARNISIDLDICENLNSYKNETINMNAIIKNNNLADLCKTDDSKETESKKKKKKIFGFKKRENKKKKSFINESGNENSPLLSIKIDFKNLKENQNDKITKDKENKDQ